MNELALFAGAGGGILGGKLLGWRTVCAVERDAYAAAVLAQRQNDGHLDPFPIWSDIETFDGKPWRGLVDVVSGGFPCQDISCAGKGAGITGERSGLWAEMARVVREVGPRFVFVENSPMLTSRGLGVVLGDLAEMGFDAEWGVLGAYHAGAPHKRDRIWIMADRIGSVLEVGELHDGIRAEAAGAQQGKAVVGCCKNVAFSNSRGCYRESREQGQEQAERGRSIEGCENLADSRQQQRDRRMCGVGWWDREPLEALRDAWEGRGEETWLSIPESELGRVANGVAHRVDRLKAIGNGQVPAVVKLAWEVLSAS